MTTSIVFVEPPFPNVQNRDESGSALIWIPSIRMVVRSELLPPFSDLQIEGFSGNRQYM